MGSVTLDRFLNPGLPNLIGAFGILGIFGYYLKCLRGRLMIGTSNINALVFLKGSANANFSCYFDLFQKNRLAFIQALIFIKGYRYLRELCFADEKFGDDFSVGLVLARQVFCNCSV